MNRGTYCVCPPCVIARHESEKRLRAIDTRKAIADARNALPPEPLFPRHGNSPKPVGVRHG